jgi:hypothetical protein
MTDQAQHVGQHNATQSIAVSQASKNYTTKEVKFNFRKDKELGTKRPTVTLPVRVLTLEGLVNILESGDEKQINLILETIQVPILDQVRVQVDAKEDITAATMDNSLLSWEAISKLEPAARRGGGIPKEVWEAFVRDYIEVMPAVTGRNLEQVTNASKLLANKFASIKANKPVLTFIDAQLDIYFTNTPNGEDFADCYEFLSNKAKDLLAADDADLLKNLM